MALAGKPAKCGECKQGYPGETGRNVLVMWAFRRLASGIWDGMGGISIQGIAAGLAALGATGATLAHLTESLIDLASTVQAEKKKA